MKSRDSFSNGFKKWHPRQIFAIENVHDKIKGVVHPATSHVDKNWKNWPKTWQDLKSRTKTKSGNIIKHETGTGGGPPCLETMTLVEDKVLEVIKAVSVEGHQQSKESHTKFNFNMSDGKFNMSDGEFVLPMTSLPVPSTSTAPVPPTSTIPVQQPLRSKETPIMRKNSTFTLRKVEAKERSVLAKERIAAALEAIADSIA
ncbi:unnamed protein product [Brassicogethes aeneus]|uniref:Uncharacterized protein n=1 Tax=Brassicogethes aeneus TaxID=1431903 RepID=A0A9P0FPG4_BRAAE|nr:unnamed protein product [Brassicogethes aeneus]